ncbi:MAG TPA: acetolactate synthase, partial [Deltaproteobacteria bacterium]|nr:acetolactate synthase [Deltaproteobacteria bacterium]
LLVVLGSALEIMVRAPIRAALDRARIIVVDPAPQRAAAALPTSDVHRADLNLLLDALWATPGLTGAGPGRPNRYEVTRFLPTVVEEHRHVRLPQGDLLQSEAIAMLAERALPDSGHLLFDAGNCAASALHYMATPQALTTTIALGMGGMGYAVAGAIGAQLGAADGDRTIVLCGDGAFLMLGMELHTAVELGLPILFVVFNNAGHGMCVTRQQRFFEGRVEASRYPAASFVEIARGLAGNHDMWAGAASTPVELDAALDSLQAWNGNGPALLELIIQREEMPPFTPFLSADAPEGVLPSPALPRTVATPDASRPTAA